MHLNVIEHNNKQFVEHKYQVNVMLVIHQNHLDEMYEIEKQQFLTNRIEYNEEYSEINDIVDDDEHLINDQ
jgi:hypothetical protein